MDTGEDNGQNGGLSPSAIAELKSRHGDRLSAVNAPDGTQWVVTRPSKAVWTMFTNAVAKDGADRQVTIDRLVMDCVVYPKRDVVRSTLEEYPAYAAALSGELSTMAGSTDALDVKKL